MKDLFKIKAFRLLFSFGITLVIALIATYFLAETEYFLIPLTALYVMQTSVGSSFYQGMVRFVIVVVGIIIAALAVMSMQFFYAAAHDVLIGAVIGIAMNLILLPRRPDIEFREKILPVVKIFNDYFSLIIDQLVQQENAEFNNAELEKVLTRLPDWVYEPGFDIGLRSGYRFFLTKIEQIGDLLFSMHHLVRYAYDKELIAKLRPALLPYVENVNQFFLAVISVLELKKVIEEPSDLEEEMHELQKQLFQLVPSSLELLDMRRDYVYLAAFIYDLKDLRKLLLKLGEALR